MGEGGGIKSDDFEKKLKMRRMFTFLITLDAFTA